MSLSLRWRFAGILDAIPLWLVLLAGFSLRLVWALIVPVVPISDSVMYDSLAHRIAMGLGYTMPDGTMTAYWPVGTSAFYGLTYALFGHGKIMAAFANVGLGTLLIAATYCLARNHFDKALAKLAAMLVAIWPTWIVMTTIVSSELVSTLFLTAGLAVAATRNGADWHRTVLSSALLVGAVYCRANLLPIIFLLPAVEALTRRSARYFLTHVMLAMLTAAVLIAPWATRNYRAFGEPVAISTNLGVNLWIGNNPEADGSYMAPPPVETGPLALNEVGRDKVYRDHAMRFIRENPVRYLGLCARRMLVTFDRETNGVAWNELGLSQAAKQPLKIVMTGYWLAIFLAAVAGMVMFVRRSPVRIIHPLFVSGAIVVAGSILIMATDRYHYGLAPIIAAFAAYALLGRQRPEAT